MRSPTLLPIRMNAAETSASRAIADWTPLTVVSRSRTTAEIDTFISDVSTTSTNIAIESKMARRLLPVPSSGTSPSQHRPFPSHTTPRGVVPDGVGLGQNRRRTTARPLGEPMSDIEVTGAIDWLLLEAKGKE